MLWYYVHIYGKLMGEGAYLRGASFATSHLLWYHPIHVRRLILGSLPLREWVGGRVKHAVHVKVGRWDTTTITSTNISQPNKAHVCPMTSYVL